MRCVAGIVCLVCLSVVVSSEEEPSIRRKRFLKADSLTFLPDSLIRLGDYARDLSDQMSAQASMAVHHMMPQMPSRGGMPPMPSRGGSLRREELENTKRGAGDVLRVPMGRETEGDEKEIEIFDPEPVTNKPPHRPDPSSSGEDTTWFRPLVPFSFSFGLLTPWWEGPNVCVERSEVEEPENEESGGDFMRGFSINFETTRCVPSDSSYICTKKIQSDGQRKTISVRRQCCHGYIRRTDGRPGCAALKMENLIDTMKVLEMRRFVQWVEESGLREQLITDNYTVFAPSNEAVTDYEDEMEDNEISAIVPVRRLTDASSIVGSHVTGGFLNVDHLEDEQLIDTLNERVKIRINKYHTGQEIVTANCIPVSGKNNFATNGIVHLLSGVLPQPMQSLGEMIENDDQFSTLRKLLEGSGLMEELKKPDQPWTLFAPTDDAFRKLPRALRNQIESGEACVENILHQHLIKGTVCSSAVVNQVKVKNILDNILHITRDETEKLRVDGAIIDSENALGTNGVIHGMEKVLIPPQAQSLLKSLEQQEREDILNLIEAADMVSIFEGMRNLTFFLPSKEAMQNLPNETLEQMKIDPELTKKILLSHLVESHTPTTVFADNKHLETLNGHTVHMKLHELFPGIITGATVQCAYITSHDHHVCGAVMHKINRVIMPPEGSIMHTLKGMKDHDIIIKMLQTSELENKLEEEGPFTFLAPTDEAFERFTDESLKEMMNNKTRAEEILKLHILPETLCCNGISHITPFHRQFVRTLDGSILPLHRGLYDRVKFGRARALQCDIPASNGLVHSISRVILPQRPTPTHMFGMDLWPF